MRRREFAVTILGAGLGCSSGRGLPPGIEFVEGPVNTIRLTQGQRIACINGTAQGDPPDELLFTHHRRDVIEAARSWIDAGARVAAPSTERAWLSGARDFWSRFRSARYHDYDQYTTKILSDPLDVTSWFEPGDTFPFGDVTIEVLPTPGYSRGSVSYCFEAGGERIACTGDLIYGDGQIFDLYSLQEPIAETGTRGYHGFAARAAQLLESLQRLAAWNPTVILPARGPRIDDPIAAIETLGSRIRRLFEAYFRTDALRWYWGDDNLRARARRILGTAEPEWMELATQIQQTPPRWLRKFGTSRLLISDDGPAFLLDCGSDQIMADIDALERTGAFRGIEGIFVTHFHDDHTDRVQTMRERHACQVYTGEETKDILENPAAYHLPAMTDVPIRPVTGLAEGHTWRWREFTFRQTYFPGQAMLHSGLLAKRDSGETYFFIGDSFSPSGLDDYCLLNRHLFHPRWGHYLCLDKVEQLQDEFLLANQHIAEAFRYGPEQMATLRSVLDEKRAAIADLVPWDDPNYGTDEQWARLYPYGAKCSPGDSIDLFATVFNHSPQHRKFTFRLHLPPGWKADAGELVVSAGPLAHAQAKVRITAPADMREFEVVTADVLTGSQTLYSWAESLIERQSVNV